MKQLNRNQKFILSVCLSSVITFANIYWLQPLLPSLQANFQISSLDANSAMSAPLLGMGLGLLIFATISDSFGRRNVLLVGLGLGLVLSLLLPQATDYSMFLTIRFLQGVCLAACPATAVPLLGEELKKGLLPTAVGYYIASNTIGGISARLIAGYGEESFGVWYAGGYITAFISAALFLVTIAFLPKQQNFESSAFKAKSCISAYLSHLASGKQLLIFLTISIGFGCFVNLTNYLMVVMDSDPFNMPSDMRSIMFLTLLGGTTSSSLAGAFAKKRSQIMGVGLGIIIMLSSVLLLLTSELPFMIVGMILLAVGFFFCHANASTMIGKSAKKAKGSAQALYSLFYYSGASLVGLYLEPFYLESGWHGVLVSSAVALASALFFVCVYQFVSVRQKQLSANLA